MPCAWPASRSCFPHQPASPASTVFLNLLLTPPFQVGNQRDVERWIEVMVFHGGMASHLTGGKALGADSAGGTAASAGRAHSGLLSDASGMRAGSRAGGARPPGSGKAGQKHDLLKQATSNVKKLKVRLGVLCCAGLLAVAWA